MDVATSPITGAGFPLVGDERERRGEDIGRRRRALGIGTASEFSKRTGIDRSTIRKAEAGKASYATYVKLETFLSSAEAAAGIKPELPAAPAITDEIRVEVTGPKTAWQVNFYGSSANADVLRDQAARLIMEIAAEERDSEEQNGQ